MKVRVSFIGVVAVAMALALFGVLGGTRTQGAITTRSLQPFNPVEVGGISTSELGQLIWNYTYTDINRGQRTGLPWIYTPTGWGMVPDKEIADLTNVGSVMSKLDAQCDSTSLTDFDILASTAGAGVPYAWIEQTTAVEGTDEAFLKAIVPPYSWLVRHRADIDNIWLYGTTKLATVNVLNTVYTNVPFSPNGGTYTATTKLGGSAVWPSPAGATCLDSPQSSKSITKDLYSTPPKQADAGGPCAGVNCVDASIGGFWAANSVTVALSGSATIGVTKVLVNNGPNAGHFQDLWEAEVTAGNITAQWVSSTSPVLEVDVASLALGSAAPVTQNLQISCNATAGEGLVVLKNVLWPVPPTKETYPDDNASTFVVRVVCGTAATTLVDKEVIWIKPKAPSTDNVVIPSGGDAIITLDELKANHDVNPVLGNEWLVAEVSDVAPAGGPTDLTVAWIGQVSFPNPVIPPLTPSSCSSGDACITYQVLEPHGQMDVQANLQVTCPVATPPGLYSVVVKAIDAPAAPLGESKASDNANRLVIKVWCGTGAGTPDGKDDAAGLYPRWTAFQNANALNQGDSRTPRRTPPSIASDTGYVERTIDLQCYWLDGNGTPDPNSDGMITPVESMGDADLAALGGIATIDPDGDCLALPQYAQPGRPVDISPAPAGMCDTLPYSEAPNLITYSKAADYDCDGLVDGIERAFGSNPMVADSDNDGANDFIEMYQFTNPMNPDSDGDGYKDAPAATYQNSSTNFDNCPSVANPDQLNTDGTRRDNGAAIPGSYSSTPNQDKMGDACDPDDDNDMAVDVAEIAKGTNPLVQDSDGDGCVDGVEGYLGKDPLLKTSKCPTSLGLLQTKFFRACRWNVPQVGEFSGLWDATYTTTNPTDRAELDPDGDGIDCQAGTAVLDLDNDNGNGSLAKAPDEVADVIEIEGYNTMPANADTDGDGCPDWVEIADVSGDRVSNINDIAWVAKRVFNAPPFVSGVPTTSDVVLDMNKDSAFTIADVSLVAKNSTVVKTQTPNPCPNEN